MKKIVCQSQNEVTTKALGKKFAGELTSGGTILLYGDLGAGKTTFVQGLAEGLGITQRVTSPTFTLLSVYDTIHPIIQHLVHIDLYRITTAADIISLDVESWQNDPNTLLVVEWPERTPELWHEVLRSIHFQTGRGLSERTISFQS